MRKYVFSTGTRTNFILEMKIRFEKKKTFLRKHNFRYKDFQQLLVAEHELKVAKAGNYFMFYTRSSMFSWDLLN